MARPEIVITNPTTGIKLVKFEIPGGVTTPAEFAEAVAAMPKLSGDCVVLVNGRGPVWGYGMILHEAHATPAVACFDPRLGYIIVQSHDSRYEVGGTIDFNE